MAVLTVGSGGSYAFTEAGINAAISAAVGGDIVRIIQSGTITLTAALAPVAAITIEGDISLYTGYDKTTLPKLFTAGSTRAIALWTNGISIKNLQFEGFLITSAGNAGGAINGQGNTFGTLENLLFVNCISCVQQGNGGTIRDIRGTNVGRILRSVTGATTRVFEAAQRAGYDYIFDNPLDATGTYALGSVYQDGSRSGHGIAVVSGTGPTFRNISAHRAAGAGGTAFNGGTYSYCTVYGYGATASSATNGGNNFARDPLFTSPAAGDFTFQVSSSELDSGTAISGTTTDMIGQALPAGSGWPRGSRDRLLTTTIASVTNTILVNDQNRLRLTLAASKATDASWVIGAFTITASDGSVVPTKVSLTPDANPASYLDLVTGLQKDGGAYTVAWTGLVGISDGSLPFTGDADPPTIDSVDMLSYDKTTRTSVWRVTFSREMSSTGLSNLEDYSLVPVGLGRRGVVTEVTLGSPLTYVDLTVRGLEPGRGFRFSMDSA